MNYNWLHTEENNNNFYENIEPQPPNTLRSSKGITKITSPRTYVPSRPVLLRQIEDYLQYNLEQLANDNNNNDNNNNNEHDNNPNTQEHLYSTSTLTNKILHTVYMGTINSTNTTRNRAEMLANEISSYHKSFYIDMIVTAVVNVFSQLCGKTPRFVSQGGTNGEDLALQNIQARLRMVFAYLCAQLFPWVRGNTGFLLVVGTGNVDEALRGYMTKYDCSSADINPIGGISKGDLNKMINYVSEKYNVPTLKTIAEAPPTAELRPIIEGSGSEHSQLDEVEMGMTYKELGVFGLLRKTMRCGPVSMFLKLATMWGSFLSLSEIATKVKRFFFYYSINRHKCTTLTPSYHAENYSPDDNRFDLRPFLYNTKWTKQFETIDQLVKENEQR